MYFVFGIALCVILLFHSYSMHYIQNLDGITDNQDMEFNKI